jgi:hypothetical protein
VRRFVLAFAALALLVSACGGAEAEPVTVPAPTPSPTPEPEPEPVLAALTGLPLDDETAGDRPVLAVKIDNHRDARPPVGLELADIVIEELVEGGATRFIALYHSGDPGVVGPVRSGREVDAFLLPAFSPVFAISGAAGPVYPILRGAGLLVYEEGQAGGAIFRQSGRSSPHNVFASAEGLWAAAEDLPAADQPWLFDEDTPDGGERTTSAQMAFSNSATALWEWDTAGGVWLRTQDGVAHVNPDGDHIDAENVVVVFVPVGGGGGVDAAGNRTAHINVIGEGDAVVLRDGQAFDVRWQKDSPDDQFTWLTATGRPLPLAPGRTWIELVPVGRALDLQPRATLEP